MKVEPLRPLYPSPLAELAARAGLSRDELYDYLTSEVARRRAALGGSQWVFVPEESYRPVVDAPVDRAPDLLLPCSAISRGTHRGTNGVSISGIPGTPDSRNHAV